MKQIPNGFRQIPGENYAISKRGLVLSLTSGHIIQTRDGAYRLFKDGRTHTARPGDLLLAAWGVDALPHGSRIVKCECGCGEDLVRLPGEYPRRYLPGHKRRPRYEEPLCNRQTKPSARERAAAAELAGMRVQWVGDQGRMHTGSIAGIRRDQRRQEWLYWVKTDDLLYDYVLLPRLRLEVVELQEAG